MQTIRLRGRDTGVNVADAGGWHRCRACGHAGLLTRRQAAVINDPDRLCEGSLACPHCGVWTRMRALPEAIQDAQAFDLDGTRRRQELNHTPAGIAAEKTG